jgi:Fe2+ or Zn2+ uptake regulation protein
MTTLPPPEERLRRLLELMRARGLRMTLARRALLEQLVSAPNHLTADELTDGVCATSGRVHRATIYRSLDALEEAGIVEHVHLGHGRAVYHLADDLHHHLVCESCGAVSQAPDGLLAGVQRRLRETLGFTIRPYHFAMLGRCRDCEQPPAVSELPAG